jgi:hypothetical protein
MPGAILAMDTGLFAFYGKLCVHALQGYVQPAYADTITKSHCAWTLGRTAAHSLFAAGFSRINYLHRMRAPAQPSSDMLH